MEVIVGQDGAVVDGSVDLAVIRNQARLNYNEVAAWLQGSFRR